MKQIGKGKNIINSINIIIVLLTFYRIYLAYRIPLYLQADAGLDDFLMIEYAKNIINFKWLGTFNSLTLVKTPAFSIFLALGHWINCPYSILLILTYILSILIFIVAISKILKNKYFLSILYIFLLYSPVMFHIENVQKVYRGGLIVSFAMMVISATIGIYTRKKEKISNLYIWSILLSISLSFFWFIKEDSIWILPFVMGGLTLAIIQIIIDRLNIHRFKTRIFIILVPLLFLFVVNIAYKSINFCVYGEYAVTDREGTYYKEVLNDLLSIKNKKVEDVWITKDTIYKAMSVSPTLKSIKPQIDQMYETSWALLNGEIHGDMIFWTLRSSADDAGIYNYGARVVNQFYKKIDQELDLAFESGNLEKEQAIYISSVAKGITSNDIKFFKDNTIDLFKVLITYSENEVGYYSATGDYADIELMKQITKAKNILIDGVEENTHIKESLDNDLQIINNIVNFYQKTGIIIFLFGTIGIGIFSIRCILNIIKKKYEDISLFYIICGLIVTCLILFIGVEWFVSWFGDKKYRFIYNYSCGIIPIIQVLELIGIYQLFETMKKILKRNKKTR